MYSTSAKLKLQMHRRSHATVDSITGNSGMQVLGSCFPKAPQCLEGARVSVKLGLWLFSFQKSSRAFELEIPVLTAPGTGTPAYRLQKTLPGKSSVSSF